MRVLHIGAGLRPWRRGGLVAYIEDLMDEQVRRGDEVFYFFSGREYPLLSRPRLHRWRRSGVAMLEVVNSPLYDHGRQPELEVSEPHTERMLASVVQRVRPDVAHVQELAGLPFSMLDVLRSHDVPAVVTLQDYFPLCSTFKLLDARGQVCLRREVGADCAQTVAADPRPPSLMFEATIRHHLDGLRVLDALGPKRRERVVRRLASGIARREARRRAALADSAPSAASFQRRRDLNIERLNRAESVIAMSRRVAEIYRMLGVESPRLRTLHLTLAHIQRIRPRVRRPGKTITFATLAGFESEEKGALVLLEAMRLQARAAAEGTLRLLVFGHVRGEFAEAAAGVAGIEIRGRYAPDDQERLLGEVDVGIMPSIWEEAYGYAGIEFLAAGIPVIANAIGGMTDYTRDGETGWLNTSCSAEELARIMGGIGEQPEQVADLSRHVVAAHGSIVKSMARHTDEMYDVYRDAIEARSTVGAG